jgi:hypothetical protein
MARKAEQTSGDGGVQVFELTMDNPEDQDELNRRLRKPGEPAPYLSPEIGRTGHGKSTAESTGKKKGKRKGSS